MHIPSECERDREADVLLERDQRSRDADHLVSVARSARPRELQSAITVQRGVPPGSFEPVAAIAEQCIRGVRVSKQQRRENERFDVPHHLSAVVVVVRPIRETEHRGAEERGGMRRCVEVVKGGVGKLLPATTGPGEDHTAAPEVGPCLPILLAEAVKTELRADGREASGLPMWLGMHLICDDRRDRTHHAGRAGTGAKRVHGVERCESIVLLAFAFGVLRTLEARDVRGTAAAKPTVRLPEQRPIDDGFLRARGVGLALPPSALDADRVYAHRDRELAWAVHADAQLV